MHRETKNRLEGVDRRKLKFTTLNTVQAGVSVIIKSESGIEGKTNQPRKLSGTIIRGTPETPNLIW